MSFSRGSFYGKQIEKKSPGHDGDRRGQQWQDRLKKIEDREAFYKKHPTPKIYRPKIDDPCIYRKTFYRQHDAFEYARSKSEELHVFAYESSSFQGENSGKRMYMVCSYPHFWHYYRQMMKHGTCHHYEVIPEGAVCKLYFDLEFEIRLNPIANGDKMVQTFIKFIDYNLKKHYNIFPDMRQVVDLFSHSPGKFSRHLIYLIKGIAFKDNIHAGNFVNHVCSQLMDVLRPRPQEEPTKKKLRRSSRHKSGTEDTEQAASTESVDKRIEQNCFGLQRSELENLLVKDRDGNEVLFVDLGVYTKNRNFRMFKSSKLGKNNPLEYKQSNYYTVSTPIGRGPIEQIFLDSLIANVEFSPYLRLLTWEEKKEHPRAHRKTKLTPTKEAATAAPMEGYSSSPFPEIDEFIASILNIGGVQGSIRRWSYFTQGELVVYEISNYRWCENIRRHHKSNNIMFVVDLKKGVYYQKCHDPECRRINFKSDEYPLPRELLPKRYFTKLDDDFLEDVSDEDLLSAASSVQESTDISKGCLYNQTKAKGSSNGTTCVQSAVKTSSLASAAGYSDVVEDVDDGEMLNVLNQVENCF